MTSRLTPGFDPENKHDAAELSLFVNKMACMGEPQTALIAASGVLLCSSAFLLSTRHRSLKNAREINVGSESCLQPASCGLRIFIYVQHLRGIGHLQRISVIVRSLADSGAACTVVSGGSHVPSIIDPLQQDPNVTWHTVAPCHVSPTDTYGWKLLDENGQFVTKEWEQHRKNTLLRHLEECKPHAILIEMYPFGRRKVVGGIIFVVMAG
jgi:hypothetical protein